MMPNELKDLAKISHNSLASPIIISAVTHSFVVGHQQWHTFWVVGCRALAEIVCLKYSTSCNMKEHFSGFNESP